MNVLWVTNIILPEASGLLGESVNPFGGWLVNASNDLSRRPEINLFVASPSSKKNETVSLIGENIKYFIFPWNDKKSHNDSNSTKQIEGIIKTINPDVVHVFGTEFSHSLIFIRFCKALGISSVVSIQGLVSICAEHYMANLPCNIQKKYTLRDLIRQDNLVLQQRKYATRGRFENETIKNTENIIGRTTWDFACTKQISSNVNYHFCNESLREVFYENKWDIKTCDRHSIFTSQASYPIKGIHHVLRAMPIILKQFPDAKLYIAGDDIFKSSTLKDKIRKSSYSSYISYLIKKYNIEEHVYFTGILNDVEMCKKYLESNVFVCPSSIENSPNSLGEAMILGVPCVASYVGGVPDMMTHNQDGYLYQSDAYYMLAHYICELFKNDAIAKRFSKSARLRAIKTHDVKENTKQLIDIYHKVLQTRITELFYEQ